MTKIKIVKTTYITESSSFDMLILKVFSIFFVK